MFLLDTMVISETFEPHGDAHVQTWLAHAASDRLHLSVMTIGELERGIARARHGHPAFAARLGHGSRRSRRGTIVAFFRST